MILKKNAKERIKKGVYVLEKWIYFTFSLYEQKVFTKSKKKNKKPNPL